MPDQADRRNVRPGHGRATRRMRARQISNMLGCALSLLLGLALPAAAQTIAVNEPLVMRLIFDDCLGYVVDKRAPFEGLDMSDLSPEVERSLLKVERRHNRKHLLSDRYYAIWGEDEHGRHCMIRSVDDPRLPALLGVQTAGFLDRLSARAAAAGMTEADVDPPIFDALHVHGWSEPGGDNDRELRMTVLPALAPEGSEVLDIGLIIVAAGWGRVTP